MYKPVVGLPVCSDANNKKAIWRDIHKEGIDFSAFRQYKEPANFDGSCPQENGVYVKLTDTAPAFCYSYDYINAMCLLVRYVENYDANQAAWEFVGGCFQNGEVTEYLPGEPGKVYSFENVQIEVRQANSYETEEK